jgi:hypothetical protein
LGISTGFLAGFFAMLTHAVGANTFIIVRIMEPFWFLTAIVIMIPQIAPHPILHGSETTETDMNKGQIQKIVIEPKGTLAGIHSSQMNLPLPDRISVPPSG